MLKRLLIGFAFVACVLPIPPPAAQAADDDKTVSYVSISGTGRDWVTQGNSYFYGLGDGTVEIYGSPSTYVWVRALGGTSGDQYDLMFEPPTGEEFSVGEWYGEGSGGPDHARMDIWGHGNGCAENSGTFTIKELAPDLSRLWITFESHCGNGVSASFGEIKVNMPADSSGVDVAPTAIDWPDVRTGTTDVVGVRIRNEAAEPGVVGDVAVTGGDGAFAVVSNSCGELAAGRSCIIEVELRAVELGTHSGALTIADSGGAVTHAVPLSATILPQPVTARITTDRLAYRYGESAQVIAALGGTTFDPIVTITKRVDGGPMQHVVTSGVNRLGRVRAEVPIKGDTVFYLSWVDGEQSGTGFTSAELVPIDVDILPESDIYDFGRPITLHVRMTGAPTPNLSVYRESASGPRVLVSDVVVDSDGRAVVEDHALTTSTYTAEWTDAEGAVVATSSANVAVHARSTLWARRYARKVEGGYIFRPGTPLHLVGLVEPSKAGQQVTLISERWVDGRFRPLAPAIDKTLTVRSRARFGVAYRPRLRGSQLRFTLIYPGDDLHAQTNSNEVYIAYRGRRP